MAIQLLDSYTVGSGGQASVTFSNIAQTGTHLWVRVSFRGEYAGESIAASMRINNQTTSIYPYRNLRVTTSDYASFGSSGNSSAIFLGFGGGSTGTSGVFGNTDILITNYTSAITPTTSMDNGLSNKSASQYHWFRHIEAGNLDSAAAVTSLNFYSNYGDDLAEGSTFQLYTIS